MKVNLPLDEKILKFAGENFLYIVGQYVRDRKYREVKFYTISTEERITLGTIKPDCTYEQFLEVVASKALLEIERLYDLNEEVEDEYGELYDKFTALKEEATNDI